MTEEELNYPPELPVCEHRKEILAALRQNPVIIELHYPSGKVLDVDLGATYRVAGSMSFLSELSKIVPPADTTFRPSDKIYLAPREPKPWER